MPSKPKSYSSQWIEPGCEDEQAFRDGVKRNGNAMNRCPLCDGKRLFWEDRGGYCKIHQSWKCWRSAMIACHDCKRRWGVVIKKCREAA